MVEPKNIFKSIKTLIFNDIFYIRDFILQSVTYLVAYFGPLSERKECCTTTAGRNFLDITLSKR